MLLSPRSCLPLSPELYCLLQTQRNKFSLTFMLTPGQGLGPVPPPLDGQSSCHTPFSSQSIIRNVSLLCESHPHLLTVQGISLANPSVTSPALWF